MPDEIESRPTSAARRWLIGGAIVAVAIAGGWVFGTAIRAWRIQALHETAKSLARKNPRAASAAYERYLSSAPNDDSARLELALLLRQSDPLAALSVLRAISPAAPEHRVAARHVAVIAIELGRDYDALEPLLYLQELQPQDPAIPLTLAQIYYRARDLESAIEQAAKCRQIDSEQVEACLLQAEALDDAKRSAEMIEPLEAALRVDPELPQAHLNLAYAYQLVGRFDEGLVHVRWFLARYPNSAAAHRVLAQVERGLGRSEQALTAIRRSRQLQPQNLDAALIEAELLLFLRQPEEAYALLSEISPEFAADRRVIALLLRSAVMSGRQDEASRHRARFARLSLS